MTETLKKYATIGCCGIDCGLCQRYHSSGDSACPGCGGLNFSLKHPSCGYLTCCAKKHGFEMCADCNEYPCARFDAERYGFDSFVTHKKVFINLDNIKNNGILSFIENQKIRMDILTDLLANFDDGRSKSFFCLSCALLPLGKLQEACKEFKKYDDTEMKEKANRVKARFNEIAESTGVEIKLNKKVK